VRFLADAAQGAGRRCSAPYDEISGPEAATHSDTVLVTDTTGDVEAALTAGVRAVGVSWGMHSPDKLLAAGAEFVAVWPQELIAYLRPDSVPAGVVDGQCAVTSRSPAPMSDGSAESAADIRIARRTGSLADAGASDRKVSGACGCAPHATRSRSVVHGTSAATSPAIQSSSIAELIEAMRATRG
jgi:phosphoglycolate phosphatase